MDKYQETFATWNKIAGLYEERFMDLDLYNETYDFICQSIVRQKADILEIGCGPGNITKYLLNRRPDFQILGIDIAPNMIALAEKNNPSARFAVMDCRDICTLGTPFDAIIGGFCLPYLSQTESEQLIADAAQLLSDDGFIYLSFVEGQPHQSGFKTGSAGDRTYFYYHELEHLKRMLHENGFEALKTFKVKYEQSDKATELHTVLTAVKS